MQYILFAYDYHQRLKLDKIELKIVEVEIIPELKVGIA